MPFVDVNTLPARDLVAGIHARILHADRLTVMRVAIDAGARLPVYAHPHEQVTTVLAGTLVMTVGAETRTLTAGMTAVIPGNVEHSAHAVDDVEVLDVFTPVREDYR